MSLCRQILDMVTQHEALFRLHGNTQAEWSNWACCNCRSVYNFNTMARQPMIYDSWELWVIITPMVYCTQLHWIYRYKKQLAEYNNNNNDNSEI